MIKRNPVRFVLSLIFVTVAAGVGSAVTYPSISTWYAALQKPFFNPPNWVFGPVWTVLYILMAVSLYLVWSARTTRSKRGAAVGFAVQLVLNVMWSVVFFGLHQPWAAVGVIFSLWLAIAVTMWTFWPISRLATYLLVPYLAWVSFASSLNISVAILNPAQPSGNYEECVKAPGSVILDSYPSICMTRDKRQFINPSEQAQPMQSSTLSIPELSAKLPLVSGITDAYYSYTSTTKEAYVTTTTLEELRKTLLGCKAGMHGFYIKREAAALKEQPHFETQCITPATDTTRQIESIQELLRHAIDNAMLE